MSKKQKVNKQKVSSATEKPAPNKMLKIGKNVLVLLLTFFIITQIKQNDGYKWVLDTLVSANLKTMKENKHLTEQQKLEAKMGYTARYFNEINKKTPEDAVIIFPPDSLFAVTKYGAKLDRYMRRKEWSSYFVYPRKLIYHEEKEKYPELYKKATHVAIINGWGFQLLPYQVQSRNAFDVLPLKDEKK